MNLDLDTTAAEWIAAKEAEREAVERRRALEDHMLSLLGVPDTLDGTATTETDGKHKIKVVGRIGRKVDGDLAQEIAAEHGLENYLAKLFRWKPDLDLAVWKATDPEVTTPFLKAITSKPGRPSFTIEQE
ncbi:MAG TPA: hypothetical protein VMV54_01245 [Acidocella sp.]|nr:hypothetical protein [Acidocella sp.]